MEGIYQAKQHTVKGYRNPKAYKKCMLRNKYANELVDEEDDAMEIGHHVKDP